MAKKTLKFAVEVPFDEDSDFARPDQIVEIFRRVVSFNFPVSNISSSTGGDWKLKDDTEHDEKAKS